MPTLVTDDGESLGTSLAIVDWLDRHFPQTPLLPRRATRRAAGAGNCLRYRLRYAINNMRVLRYHDR
ncbi:glutathione S-transferase N-terminal domain-containing protein [Salmonella enterica subsp. enterica]|nr:glutathione S-transferase N-terminal domain-containing protein [Salmonella enterica subsp. enterica]